MKTIFAGLLAEGLWEETMTLGARHAGGDLQQKFPMPRPLP